MARGAGHAGTGDATMAGTGTARRPRPTTGDGLRRSLGFRDLVVYGLLFIAPMAPVGVFGTLDAKSHGAVALVYIVATVAMAFTAFSYAQMVRVVPAGGFGLRLRARGARQGPRVHRRVDGDARLPPHPRRRLPLLRDRDERAGPVGLPVGVDGDRGRRDDRAEPVGRTGGGAGRASRCSRWRSWCCWSSWCRRSSCWRGDGAQRGWLSPLTGDGTQGAFALRRCWARCRWPCCRIWASTRSPRSRRR